MKNNTPVLEYSQQPRSNRTVRAHFDRYRKDNGIGVRCDNPECQFHTGPLVWNGKPVKMILDHIDGNRLNNRAPNLRLVCPSCNSQLPTTGGANKGRIKDCTADSYVVVDKATGVFEKKVLLHGVQAQGFTGKLEPQ